MFWNCIACCWHSKRYTSGDMGKKNHQRSFAIRWNKPMPNWCVSGAKPASARMANAFWFVRNWTCSTKRAVITGSDQQSNHLPCYRAACPCEQHQTTIKRHPARPRREHGWRVSENLLVNKLTFESGEKARKHLPATLSIIMGRKIVAHCLSQCGETNKAGLGRAALPRQLLATSNSCQKGNYPWSCSPGAVQYKDDVCLETAPKPFCWK